MLFKRCHHRKSVSSHCCGEEVNRLCNLLGFGALIVCFGYDRILGIYLLRDGPGCAELERGAIGIALSTFAHALIAGTLRMLLLGNIWCVTNW